MNADILNCTIVITTFYSGVKLEKCLKNIPDIYKKLIIDNGGEIEKKKYFENKFPNLTYHVSSENLGVPGSYSLANKMVNTRFMFNTQPDVIIKKNCIENLLKKTNQYPKFAILSPTIFHNGKYLVEGDYRVLKKKGKKFIKNTKTKYNISYTNPPHGDLSVDAVTGTAMLIDREKIREINDWDTKIFNYFEDMDLCLRLRFKGFEIIKIRNAEVDHDPFASHDISFDKDMDFSRNWHYSWSSYYFLKKHTNITNSLIHGIKILLASSIKFLFYSLFNKRKSRTHFAKAYGMLFSILNIKSNYRPNIKL
tara:strand:- start:3067 stop:3993 length:927 start_codon:yes stop_codon:yes gene_type:complete